MIYGKAVSIVGIVGGLLGTGAALAPALSLAAERNPCIVARIAIDIGSGSSKMRSGIVDVCEQKVLFQIAKGKKGIGFKDNLTRSGSDGKHFDSEFLAQAVKDIKGIFKTVKAETIEKLKNDDKYSDYAYLADSPIEVKGVCTEAFRQAENAVEFFDAMRGREGGLPSLPVRKLSQVEEGRLGYMGALVALGNEPDQSADPRKTISWDIGGGSMQFVAYQGNNTWNDYGNKFASNPERLFVQVDFEHKDKSEKTPNPVLKKSDGAKAEDQFLDAAMTFAKGQLGDLTSQGWLGQQIQAGSQVNGIGGVHGGVIGMVKKLPGRADATGYSQADLKALLDKVLYASDDDIATTWGVEKAFANGSATNALLIYTAMKTLGIQQVHVLDVDNSLGTMVSPSFWKSLNVIKDKDLVDPTQ